ncbi:MAG: NAD-dependent epimerase/dehydratase family protein [Actinophytocola sp.]|uniref:NAD-dependent epimerase/dehydratase family protein n=1 Tax=Actinophytocola sp. TaxID=1872138 RepID=UPI003D6B8CBC
MSHQPSRVLVTGAAGRLGRIVLSELAARGATAVGLDRRDPGDTDTERFHVGDAADTALVRAALAGVDTVIHLAAIPTPEHLPPAEVFVGNAAATFVVLDEAARAGVARAVIASSFSITGLPFGPSSLRPAHVPIDESTPLQVADPYALSKQADEAFAAMIARRDAMTVTALRFPLLGWPGDGQLAEQAQLYRANPGAGTSHLWTYLDGRDAARACWLAATAPLSGFHPVFVTAPDTLAPYPTEELLDTFLAGVPRRASLPGRTVPVDLTAARTLLGFATDHEFTMERA